MAVHTASWALAVLVAVFGGLARADAPPPDGMRFVRYGFRVDGLIRFPDRLVVAFPWSQSNGAPTREHAVMNDGALLEVGRRSPTVVLYSVSRAAWEAFIKTPAFDGPARADAIARFLEGPDALRCATAPSPRWMVPEEDTRIRIEEVFEAKALDAEHCTLEHPAPPPPPEVPVSGTGCGGCSGGASSSWLLAAVILGLRRRHARARERA